MKQCAYCGRENPDDAAHCSECGNLLEPPKSKNPKPRAPRLELFSRRHLFLRAVIAVSVGLVISGISLKAAWRQSRGSIAWLEQRITSRKLIAIGEVVVAYQQASNACPENFEQLQAKAQEISAIDSNFDSKEWFVDSWDHPFVFSHEGSNCLVVSYGADGKPGGIGIDCDLTTQHPLSKESIPTFGQFWANKRTQDIIDWCFVCGAVAAALSFLTVRVPDFTKRGLLITGSRLVATVAATLFIASIITALHVPSGH